MIVANTQTQKNSFSMFGCVPKQYLFLVPQLLDGARLAIAITHR